MSQCQARTKAGKPCRAPATAGGLCFLHANPSKARELGRVGGRKNRQQEPELPAPNSMTLAQVNEVLIETLYGLQSKKVSPRRASAVVQVCSVLQRSLPAADLEARITRLEEQAAEQSLGAAVVDEPDPGSVQGSAGSGAPEASEVVEPEGTLSATSEPEKAEGISAASNC